MNQDILRTRRLKVKEIKIDNEINIRDLDLAKITEYAADMVNYGEKDWQKFWLGMPIVTEDNHLWSGFHTVHAAKQAFGENHRIELKVEGAEWLDAYKKATGTNSTHGTRRTNADKRKAVLRWLQDERLWDWTNNHIAKMCRVSQTAVENAEKSLTLNVRKNYNRPTYRRYMNKYREESFVETDPVKIEEAKRIAKEEEERMNPPIPQTVNMFDKDPEIFSHVDIEEDSDDNYTEDPIISVKSNDVDPFNDLPDPSLDEQITIEDPDPPFESEVKFKPASDNNPPENKFKIRIAPSLLIWNRVLQETKGEYKSVPLTKISIEDCQQLRKDFRRMTHANSFHVKDWYNKRDSEYQHSWNTLSEVVLGMLNSLEISLAYHHKDEDTTANKASEVKDA